MGRRPQSMQTTRGVSGLARSLALGAAALLVLSGTAGCGPVRPSPDPQRSRVARSAAELQRQPSIYLVLKLDQRRLYVMQDGEDGTARPLDSYPVAIGRNEYATPIGRFHVTKMKKDPAFVTFDWKNPSKATGMIPPGPDNPLGQRWIGFASSTHGWDVGFHGTPKPELLGQAVSHGCVRMHNRDVVGLYERVHIGTPVIVQQ